MVEIGRYHIEMHEELEFESVDREDAGLHTRGGRRTGAASARGAVERWELLTETRQQAGGEEDGAKQVRAAL